MKIVNTEKQGVYEIWNATIRGYDWKLIRKHGVGTYAIVAGETNESPDLEIVIEEYPDPERRKIWDDPKSLFKVAVWAYNEALKYLDRMNEDEDELKSYPNL